MANNSSNANNDNDNDTGTHNVKDVKEKEKDDRKRSSTEESSGDARHRILKRRRVESSLSSMDNHDRDDERVPENKVLPSPGVTKEARVPVVPIFRHCHLVMLQALYDSSNENDDENDDIDDDSPSDKKQQKEEVEAIWKTVKAFLDQRASFKAMNIKMERAKGIYEEALAWEKSRIKTMNTDPSLHSSFVMSSTSRQKTRQPQQQQQQQQETFSYPSQLMPSFWSPLSSSSSFFSQQQYPYPNYGGGAAFTSWWPPGTSPDRTFIRPYSQSSGVGIGSGAVPSMSPAPPSSSWSLITRLLGNQYAVLSNQAQKVGKKKPFSFKSLQTTVQSKLDHLVKVHRTLRDKIEERQHSKLLLPFSDNSTCGGGGGGGNAEKLLDDKCHHHNHPDRNKEEIEEEEEEKDRDRLSALEMKIKLWTMLAASLKDVFG